MHTKPEKKKIDVCVWGGGGDQHSLTHWLADPKLCNLPMKRKWS